MREISEFIDRIYNQLCRTVKDLDDVHVAIAALKELREKEIFVDFNIEPIEVRRLKKYFILHHCYSYSIKNMLTDFYSIILLGLQLNQQMFLKSLHHSWSNKNISLVFSKLYYVCSKLPAGSPKTLLDKLFEKLQNSAGRLVLSVRKHGHITSLLHYLPIQAGVEFKLLLIFHHCFRRTSPGYIVDVLAVYSSLQLLLAIT